MARDPGHRELPTTFQSRGLESVSQTRKAEQSVRPPSLPTAPCQLPWAGGEARGGGERVEGGREVDTLVGGALRGWCPSA